MMKYSNKYHSLFFVMIFALFVLTVSCTAQNNKNDINCSMVAQGLVENEKAEVDLAYVRPGANLSKYKTVYIRPLHVTEEARDATPRSTGSRNYRESWILRDKDIKVLVDEFARIMKRDLEEGDGYKLVSEPGADTLIIVPAIIDIYLAAPIEDTRKSSIGRGATLSTESGKITLSATLADGETGQVIARVIDKKYRNSMLRRNTRLQNISDLRYIYSRWAKQLRERLDQVWTKKN